MNDASKTKVLFIDDEEAEWTPVLRLNLEPLGIDIHSEQFAENAVPRIRKDKFDVVLLDVWFGKGPNRANKGKDALRAIKRHQPDLPVIMLTSTLTDAHELNPADFPGAAFFFAKRQLDLRKHPDGYMQLSKQIAIVMENAAQSQNSLDDQVGFFIGRSEAMKRVAELVLRLAMADITVLITGENGTGKGLVAKAIHQLSRAGRPFMKVDCRAFAETLIESELFGHEKGAFTGAHARKIGRFEAARDGTVFLDEIGNVTLPVQAKLLGVLEDRQFERVGGTQRISLEARLIAATNTDLARNVENGQFRRDLYHRLKVAEIHLPPLRDRLDDIPNLYAFIVSKKNREHDKAVATEIRDDVLQLLQRYAWPGNVREFEHAIEAAMVKCRANVLTVDAFDLENRLPDEGVLSMDEAVSRVLEKKLPWDTIREKGNKRRSDFVKQLINRLIEKIGSGVTQDILANYLCTNREIVKQILKDNEISLRATKKSMKIR